MYTCELPSGNKVSVEAPNYSHRIATIKEYRSLKEEVGYSAEELMAAKSIVSVNGQPIDQSFVLDPLYIIADWPPADVQYFLEWYMVAFFLDDKIRDKATDAAKKLMVEMHQAKSKKLAAKA